MDYRVLMCVKHRFANRMKQSQSLINGAFALAAIFRERKTFDVFHYEPRSSIGEDACVIKPCDARMIQLCERSLLNCEAFASRGRKPGIAQKFDRHKTAEILAFCEIDNAHSAFAEHVLDFVMTKLTE